MNKTLETKITLFDSHFATPKNKVRDITINHYVDLIKDGDQQTAVLNARKALHEDNDPKGYKTAKDSLPGAVGSGIIPDGMTRNSKNTKLNGYIVIDIDRKPTVEGDERITDDEIEAVFNDPHVLLVHRSVSDWGICAFVKVDEERLKDAFYGLEVYFMEQFGFEIDPSCKNFDRFRYLSYDPAIMAKDKAPKVFKSI